MVQGIIPLHIESILVFTSAGYICEINWRFPSIAPGLIVLKSLSTSKYYHMRSVEVQIRVVQALNFRGFKISSRKFYL